MPLVKIIKENNCKIAIWNLTESSEELAQLANGFSHSAFKNEKRKKEFLASRLLLQEISPNTKISYNEFGAPELSNGKFISISHSKNLVAIIISTNKVGLDIEQISEKPLKLFSKFIKEEIYSSVNKEKATLIWCCKESIYKWHQSGNVDFKNDIKIIHFILEDSGTIVAEFKKQKHTLHYKKIDNHFLAYVCAT